MKPSLIAAYVALVLMPLGLLGWMGLRLAMDEQEIVRHRFRQLLQVGLQDTEEEIHKQLKGRTQSLLRTLESTPLKTDALRAMLAHSGLLRQVFVLGADCRRLHPPLDPPWTRAEREFLAQVEPAWPDLAALCRHRGPEGSNGAPARSGWKVWRSRDIHIVRWQRLDGGELVGLELDSTRLLADIIGSLPHDRMRGGRVALVDSVGEIVYQWGRYEPAPGELPRASLDLGPPLGAWKLVHYASAAEIDRALGSSMVYSLLAGLAVAAVLLLGLAVYFYRQSTRHIRDASERVSFVNRVSHELRTPLTNIRLYAEMLADSLPEDDERSHRRLDVVLSETRRLSRLIANVLTLGHKQKGQLALCTTPAVPDEIIRAVLAHFQPSLDARGIELRFEAGAERCVSVDTDALEQILGNLISNAERYAAEGGLVAIESRQKEDKTVVWVSDRGPGIPSRQRDKVFEAFHRVSDKLTDSSSGTGLGLAIARDLARMHGGDLTLESSEVGARFRVVLRTPAATPPER
ncbi:MAG: HAMP domain-containing histidine kinase [Deltaproteobacteria bacterium]|nr:HAMP domain-containing histidine kinase [Deltaproteobacteria bacterium]